MLHKSLIRLLVLLILLSGAPVDTAGLLAQDKSAKQTTKKPASSKKRPTKKKPRTSNKTGSKKSPTKSSKSTRPTTRKKRATTKPPSSKRPTTRKKRPTSTKKPSSRSSRKPTGEIKRKATTRPSSGTSRRPVAKPATTVDPPQINTVKLADDIYNLTDELTSSNRQLEQAISYLRPLPKRQIVRLESKPVFSLSELEKSVRKEPRNSVLQFQLAREYEKRHDLSKAKDIYLRLVYQQPRNPDTHFYLGSFYASIGELGKAEHAFTEALAIDSNHPATLDMIASMSGSQDSFPVAEKPGNLKKHQTDDAAGLITMIKRQLESGNNDRALDLAEQGQNKYPQQGGFYYLQGVALEKRNEHDSARNAYQKATGLNSENLEAHRALADLYFNQGNYLYSALSCAQVIRINSLSITYRYKLGLAYYLAGEWDHAAGAWEDLLHYAPSHTEVRNYLPQVYYILAMEYNRTGEASLGRTTFEKAISVNSNAYSWLPGALTTLGKHYREHKLYKESLASFQEVIELRPKTADTYTELGITYWKMNEKRLARAAWQRSLELDPENNSAHGWLLISRQTG